MLQYYLRPTLSNIKYNFNLEQAYYKAYTSMFQYYLRLSLSNIPYNFNLETSI